MAAVGAVPMMPSLAIDALVAGNVAALSAVNMHTYKWAEVIVRAHKTSSLAMLQRHLKIDVAAAKALQNQLIRNGVIGAQANTYGLYQATTPLFDGAFPKPSNLLKSGRELLEKVSENVSSVDEDKDAELEQVAPDIRSETSGEAVCTGETCIEVDEVSGSAI